MTNFKLARKKIRKKEKNKEKEEKKKIMQFAVF